MNDIAEQLRALGGIAPKRSLTATERQLTDAVRSGRVDRVRRGWYTTLRSDDPRVRARRIGGRLAGAAALRWHGAWMWRDPPLSVSVPGNTSRLVIPRGVLVHYDGPDVVARGSTAVVSLQDALVQALTELSFEDFVACLDWSLRTGRLSDFELIELSLSLPKHRSRIVEWADPNCHSFLESVVRTRLMAGGHRVVTQTRISPLGFIDVVVDDFVALEIDGREYHASTFESDRRKDLSITIEGRHCLRLSKSMIEDEWPRIVLAIDSALVMRKQPTRLPPLRRPPGRPAGMQRRNARLPPS